MEATYAMNKRGTIYATNTGRSYSCNNRGKTSGQWCQSKLLTVSKWTTEGHVKIGEHRVWFEAGIDKLFHYLHGSFLSATSRKGWPWLYHHEHVVLVLLRQGASQF